MEVYPAMALHTVESVLPLALAFVAANPDATKPRDRVRVVPNPADTRKNISWLSLRLQEKAQGRVTASEADMARCGACIANFVAAYAAPPAPLTPQERAAAAAAAAEVAAAALEVLS